MFSQIKTLFTREKKTRPEFHDVELGVLTGKGEIWSGTVIRDGIKIPFVVAGTLTAPDNGLLERVRYILSRFREVEREGLAFLRSEMAEVRLSEFTFYCREFLWENKPEIYAMEWLADGDDSRVWRVNYEAGKPKEAGFDD
jgi:hypothetical protein